ncbi:transcriptional regulator [Mycobacteroides chelonae]|uniref:Transcriptional regulator n=1 Tax=Mycobacteroides chelonae TaxID=1774 RepID=A0A1S1LXV5_MYCCH|nr:metalloregulator ArsR/SmtB family transcription factor [Mycobacteroides chelonae]PKQ57532.1 transcriptional regulator [Mycobacterium sp. MHSD3]SKL33685.1 Putative transcriptional regulator, ArsR family [Mycobacteroides abscessus subsp. bolletii]MBF9523966.1 helix-turn-helix transcriptional regulator [Mycobacteroides chelonae]OHU57256.1 transcriptional regulator [Mycobacteroides chelonae]OHU76022.1 transcriptional regulator [Mycobacteroides chelonae]
MSNQLAIEPVNIRCSPLVREPISAGQAVDLAKVFKALGDPVRLRLFSLIASHAGGEACVCDISPGIEVSQPTISHHLKVLRNAGLLASERRASWVYYQVVPEVLDALAGIVRIPDGAATTIPATPTEGPS